MNATQSSGGCEIYISIYKSSLFCGLHKVIYGMKNTRELSYIRQGYSHNSLTLLDCRNKIVLNSKPDCIPAIHGC